MGWGYEDWAGNFYPEGTASRDYIALYAQTFDTVEIDSTFYGTPRESQVQQWAKVTPDGFTFCAKVPRVLTHDMRLRDIGEPLAEFVRVMGLLGEKRGPMLLQFPPSFTRAELSSLEAFLPLLSEFSGAQFACEFRHRSLIGSDISSLLSRHGVALCAADYPAMPRRLEVTADVIYVRLVGRHGTYPHHREPQGDRSPDLQRWIAALHDRLNQVKSIYIQCNNDYEGFAPATAQKTRNLLGLPDAVLPCAVQGSLF
jgi:uncharacterized protein YecE (DUF72 family)